MKVNRTGIVAGVITLVVMLIPVGMLMFPVKTVEFIAGIFLIVVICVAIPFVIFSCVYSWLGGE